MSIIEDIRASKETETMLKITAIDEVAPTKAELGITIQKGVPLPTASRSRAGKYPWDKMATGDSFFVPGAKIETFWTLTSTASKKYGCRFVAKKWQEGDTEGVRVWRTEA